MSQTQSVEMYVGYPDHTWEIVVIGIPATITDEREIERVAIDATLSHHLHERNVEVSFVGVYHYEERERCEEPHV